MDLDEVADELYALPLDRFTTVRTEREKQARAGGDRELAASIHALAKPTTVAWLANQLARRSADEVGPLLDLGAALREATATLQGEQLRTLTRQRHRVVQALIARARAIGAEAGHRVTDDTARGLEETLIAALGDPDAARRLAAGRLSAGLTPSGFGGPDGSAPPSASGTASPVAQAPAAAPASGADERRRRRAEQAWEDARNALIEAREERSRADRTVERTAAAVEEAKSAAERLEHELHRAERAAQEADRAAEQARTALTQAEEAVGRAQEAERAAQHRLAGLS